MILIPQRLFADERVRTILRDGNTCILQKELHRPILNRQGYISNHVISILLSGEQHIQTYEGNNIRVLPNEILFIPRGMYFISDLVPAGGTFRSLLFYFDDAIIQEFLSTVRVTEFRQEAAPEYLKLGAVPTVNLFVDALMGIYQQQQLKNKRFLHLKILELLYLLNSLVSEQQMANFLFRLSLPQKRNIKSFMESNYDKPLKIEDYAYLTGRSLSSFRRDFKFHYNTTPQKWIKDRRLDKASQLLDSQDRSVTEVAFEVGYENISYFIREFKKRLGQSPKQYQLSKQRNQLDL
ncbi:MAG: AraC family transcriptional regulator [Bacteroidota bacterium]